MKIVWLTWKDLDNPLAGGAEVVNEELAARLVQAGHHVTFLTGGWSGAPPQTTRRGFAIIRTGRRFTSYLTAATFFIRHRHQLAPELVIDESNTMPYFAGWYARAPVVLMVHMLCRQIWFYEFPFPLSLIGYLAEPVYLRLVRPRRPVITVSRSTKADLIRNGFRERDIHIISEATHLAPVADLATVTKFPQPTVLVLGSVRPMKRTLEQIKAFELAQHSIPDIRLKVAGDMSGAYGAKVRAYIAASPAAPAIEIVGKVTADQKLHLMRQCHLILAAAVKEGWGLTITEAAAQGTPAVVYDVDGLRDAVRHGQTGLVTMPTPASQAAGIVELLANNPARYAAFRQAAWEWSRQLTFDQAYRDLVAALPQLASGPGAAEPRTKT